MLVDCAICGFMGDVHDYHRWYNKNRRYPVLWICDLCKLDLHPAGRPHRLEAE